MPLLITAAFLVWWMLWTALAVMATQAAPLGRKIDAAANLLPAFVVLTCVPLFFLLPTPVSPPSIIVRSIHYSGIILLFLFLAFGAFCQGEAWLRMRNPDADLGDLTATYRRWWVAVRLAPAPAALLILGSGVRLFYECPATADLNRAPHMWWLVTLFGILFFDGLMFYLPEICYQYRAVTAARVRGMNVRQFCRTHRHRREEAMLLLHSLSLPLVYAVAVAKPDGLWVPKSLIRWLIGLFPHLSRPDARAAQVFIYIVMVGVLMLAIRAWSLARYIRFFRQHQRSDVSSEGELICRVG